MRRSFVVLIILAACGPDPSADDTSGDDAGSSCVDSATQCEGNTFETCTGGSWMTTAQCPLICDDGLGCIACRPDSVYCDGDDVMTCASDGSGGTVTQTCTGGQHCSGGACVDLCADAAANKSYIACDYYAVDLDNAIEVINNPFPGLFTCADLVPGAQDRTDVKVCWNSSTSQAAGLCDENDTCPSGDTCQFPTDAVCVLDAEHSPFAVVVSNPQSFAVDVTISNGTGVTHTVNVAAGQVTPLFPQQLGFPDQSLDRSMQGKNAYRIVSSDPIVAYQFNPLDNVDVFSNDASLLIPTTTWDVDAYAMTYPGIVNRPDDNDFDSYIAIVASQDGTIVEVTPSASTRPNGTFPALTAGTAHQLTLDAYDVVELAAVEGGDMTGTLVHSLDPTKPVGVFAGHEAGVVEQGASPNPSQYPSGPCCADHLEEMMMPTSTWGKAFAVARSQQRNGEPDNLRVMAQQPGTTVTFTPAATPVSGNCASLGPGQFCEVKIAADTEVSANNPVLVGHYLEAVIWTDSLGTQSIGSGDPSLSLVPPTEQYRHDYAILVPSQYTANYLSIATTATGSVIVDGNDVSAQMAPFASSYRGGRVAVTAGQHTVSCSEGCGVEVMGYSDAVSYLFPGGLDLHQIVVN